MKIPDDGKLVSTGVKAFFTIIPLLHYRYKVSASYGTRLRQVSGYSWINSMVVFEYDFKYEDITGPHTV